MKLSFIPFIIGLTVHSALAAPGLKPRRTSSLLLNHVAQPDLPQPRPAYKNAYATNSSSGGLNLDDIQGDVLIGEKKNKELFFFFGIQNATAFKSKLSSDISPLVTNTNQLLSVDTQPVTAVNIAFSQSGLTALGVTDNLKDSAFSSGQFADAENLGDPGTSNWISGFIGTRVHGVLMFFSDTDENIDEELSNIQSILGDSVTEVHRLNTSARPGDQQGHEHFGYLDGISQPAIEGFTQDVLPGQMLVPPGSFILGADGDLFARPQWAVGGSFLAFRQMQQMVPEFNKYVRDNAVMLPGLSQTENFNLFGARLFGRWKSGAPVDLAPLQDDPELANDKMRSNNFTYDHPEYPGFDMVSNQTNCPFSAHIRKTRPRRDFNPEEPFHHIIRASIPYGPEVTDGEHASNKSSTDPSLERGLAFVAYQSSIENGFKFMQTQWVNDANFFIGKPTPPGVDPIIGRIPGTPADAPRNVSGTNPMNQSQIFTLDSDIVISRGGEYFFVPPISALSGVLAA
ncbi:dye-decolorizing heme-containing peroxidase [Stygiomarasmius scandens]|uniref:Dye-decolorizing heme-containing peroxidase n=1 Tax=Marasmiellus scandens TaxID=2682957 RepID=A0ABR1IY71_9AGAR